MQSKLQRFALDLGKIVLFLGSFLFLQKQVTSLRSDLSGNSSKFAMALDEYQDELSHAQKSALETLENSRTQLIRVSDHLQRSAKQLEDDQEQLTRLVSNADDRFQDTFNVEFARYQEVLKQALDRSQAQQARLDSVEEKVRDLYPYNSESMERAILYPTLQLKGSGTVGSGVLIYSRPRSLSETSAPGNEPSTAPYSTFAITACHVVMEILGEQFPQGALEEVVLLDEEHPFTPEAHAATVEIFDRDQDLALLRLRTDRPIKHVAKLYPKEEIRNLGLFTRVYAVGCPLGNNPLPTCGEISSKAKVVGDKIFWMINAPTFFGNSGGGIYLSKTCQLIGISSMIYTYGKKNPVVVSHMGLFVPADSIAEWLEGKGYGFILRGLPDPGVKEPPRPRPSKELEIIGIPPGAPLGGASSAVSGEKGSPPSR
ncbi:MAG: trypsin-like peptidase domain-containing protein [Planctomycetes bacterium]|nr:trypsin-like peptidase domain-containing protein [Planctomycetota bacterium]